MRVEYGSNADGIDFFVDGFQSFEFKQHLHGIGPNQFGFLYQLLFEQPAFVADPIQANHVIDECARG